MEVRLALSPKQHASLRLGRKVRINTGHLHGSGMQYIVRPATYDRIAHAFDRNKGVDLALSPDEVHASISGGKVSFDDHLKNAAKVSRYIGSVFKPLNKNLKPVKEAMTDAAVAQIEMNYNPSDYYLDSAEQLSGIVHPYIEPYISPAGSSQGVDTSGQTTDYIAKANMANVVANAYNPVAAPPPPPPPPVGTSFRGATPSVATGRSFHSGAGLYLGHIGRHRGHIHGHGIGAVGARHIDVRKIIKSEPHAVGFLQQIPQVYKDSVRIGAGFELS